MATTSSTGMGAGSRMDYEYVGGQGQGGELQWNLTSLKKRMAEMELSLRENAQLKRLYTLTSIPIIYMLFGLICIFLLSIYIFSGIRAITNVIGVIYPGYMSLKALKNEDVKQDMLWLSYWIWYGLFTMIESITDILLFWIPLYEFFKMGFYIYLYAPNTKGALFLYRKILQPLVIKLQQYEKQAIENIYQVKKNISDDSVTMNAVNSANMNNNNNNNNNMNNNMNPNANVNAANTSSRNYRGEVY